MSRVGIMGGTFNPPHNGHVHAARQAMAAMQFDRLLLIPDNVPPHKTMPHGSADGEQRLEMTRLMAREIPGAEACDMELRRGGRSYTADTLRALQRALPEAELFLIIGTDMLLTLDKWREPETLCALAGLVTVARDDDDHAALEQKAAWLKEKWNARVWIVDCPALPVSSTDVRADRALCRAMVPPAIYQYIEQQGLYF